MGRGGRIRPLCPPHCLCVVWEVKAQLEVRAGSARVAASVHSSAKLCEGWGGATMRSGEGPQQGLGCGCVCVCETSFFSPASAAFALFYFHYWQQTC